MVAIHPNEAQATLLALMDKSPVYFLRPYVIGIGKISFWHGLGGRMGRRKVLIIIRLISQPIYAYGFG